MANIQIKRSTTSNAPNSLVFGELAYSDGNNGLYIGKNNGTVRKFAINDFDEATGNISLGSNRIVDLANPVNANDAVNKSYLEQQVSNISLGNTWKDPVRLASVINIQLANPVTSIDSINLNDGDRILLRVQTNSGENGIYIYDDGTQLLTRSTGTDTLAEIDRSTVLVLEGSNFNSQYLMTVADVNGTINTEAITVTKIGGNGYTVGNGLLNVNTALTVDTNTDSIVIVNNKLQVKGNNVQGIPLISPTIADEPPIYEALNLANANAVQNLLPITNGGTGANSAGGARSALGLAIGTNVQAYSLYLEQIKNLTPADGNILIFVTGQGWTLSNYYDGGTY